MENKTKRNLFIALIIALLAGLIFFFFRGPILDMMYDTGENQDFTIAPGKKTKKDYVYVDPNENATSKILEIKEITGTVSEIFDPIDPADDERIVTVQADVIDDEKMKDVDFSKERNDLPMIKKEFKLNLNNQTKFIKGSLKELQPGNFVYIKTSDKIYSEGSLSAEEVTVLN